MEGGSVAIRIIGIAATARGFAFAVVEGADRLIDYGGHKNSSQGQLIHQLDAVIKRSRPLFVACEVARHAEKSDRGRRFIEALKAACVPYGIMVLCVERREVGGGGRAASVTDHELCQAVAARFPLLANAIPSPRRHWDAPSQRVGIFLAAAAAAAGWDHFRSTRSVDTGTSAVV